MIYIMLSLCKAPRDYFKRCDINETELNCIKKGSAVHRQILYIFESVWTCSLTGH